MKDNNRYIVDLSDIPILMAELKAFRTEVAELRCVIMQLQEQKLNEEILTPEQLYDYLKIKKTLLLELEDQGEIVPKRIGKKGLKRYLKEDLIDYMKRKPKVGKLKKIVI